MASGFWDATRLGLLIGEAVEMIAVPRPMEVVAKMCEYLYREHDSGDDRVTRAEAAFDDAAAELLSAWEAVDQRLDEIVGRLDADGNPR